MVHIILTLLVIYCIVRAALRGKQPDPMAGRLVHSTEEQQAALYAWRKEQHDTFDARHTVNFFRTQPATVAAPTHLQRLAEEFQADTYRRERARSRRAFESNLTRYDR